MRCGFTSLGLPVLSRRVVAYPDEANSREKAKRGRLGAGIL